MNLDTREFFDRVQSNLTGKDYEKALNLLGDDAYVDKWEPSDSPISQFLPSLKARLENSRHGGKVIYGLASLIGCLDSMPPTLNVIGYSVNTPDMAGVVYLLKDNGIGLGVVLVDL